MRFSVLGGVGVRDGDAYSQVRWPMARSVLAALLLNANRVVPVELLVDVVWGDRPPASALPSLHNHVMRLRTMLAPMAGNPIKAISPGYLIEVAESDLDLCEFQRLYRSGRSALTAGEWKTASRDLTTALGLWRAEPLADVTSPKLREREVPRLTEQRLKALEARADADIRLGLHEEVIAELTSLTTAHPLRESLYARLMLAFAGAARNAEGLAVFQRAREVLAEELGTDPGPELQRIHRQLLTGNLPAAAGPRGWRLADLAERLAALESLVDKHLLETADAQGRLACHDRRRFLCPPSAVVLARR